jgi:glycosyltransferase involved in cell wall biosynthesis
MPHLCLNMIVRNESARIIRALNSARPYINSFVILDTGSTDDTIEKIESWGNEHGIPGVVARGSFVNFSQARNQALDAARSYHSNPEAPWFDYILLMDADMELVVTSSFDPFDDLKATAYGMIQKAGAVSYTNTRLLSVTSDAKYIGVTHEYLGVSICGNVAFAHFVDHADGSNRVNKFERDIKLLKDDLETDPNNARSWYYLGCSYRDKGDNVEAGRCFRRCLDHTTWDEERWSAQVNLANTFDAQGLEDAYLKEALKAYQTRPQRAEPLHALAKHYRLKGENQTAMLFVEKGISIPRPNDLLFIEDWVYDWGFREEYSIAGFYDESTRETAFKINNGLATDPKVPELQRAQARTNMVHYLKPVREFCPSAKMTQLKLSPASGFTAMNPSITNKSSGDMELLLRTVNYKINEQGQYMIGPKGCWDAPIETENWLMRIDDNLTMKEPVSVVWDRPDPKFNMVIGLEDMRIFWHRGTRKFVACAREQSETGTPEQWHGELHYRFGNPHVATVEDARRISHPNQCEKNWSPILDGFDMKFAYRLDTFLNIDNPSRSQKWELPVAVENISGSSQYIPFRSGYLAVVHESIAHPGHGKRVYQHRFAWIDFRAQRLKLSLPFVFHDVQIEFAAGIAKNWKNDSVVVSFGVRDCEAWLCSIDQKDIAALLEISP